MSWLTDIFGGGGNITPPTQGQINAAILGTYREQQQFNPEGYKALYGNLTPEQAFNLTGGGVAYGQTDPNTFSDQLKNAIAQSRQTVPDVPDVPPDQPPPPVQPPDQPEGPPPYSGPSAREKLDALLPTGFESSLVTSGTLDPFVQGAVTKNRQGAQEFISNALKRGKLTESGSRAALSALDTQDPGARQAVTDFGNTILGTEQAKLRDLANAGRTAASGVSGEFFDPTPYKTSVDQELASFTAGLPKTFEGAPTGLYDTSSLLTAGGGVTGPQNLFNDPYAVEGGQLSTGTGDQTQDDTQPKKRTTAVF